MAVEHLSKKEWWARVNHPNAPVRDIDMTPVDEDSSKKKPAAKKPSAKKPAAKKKKK